MTRASTFGYKTIFISFSIFTSTSTHPQRRAKFIPQSHFPDRHLGRNSHVQAHFSDLVWSTSSSLGGVYYYHQRMVGGDCGNSKTSVTSRRISGLAILLQAIILRHLPANT
jgi:hypothetical protein